MTPHRAARASCVLLSVLAGAAAQTFDFPDFSDVTPLTLNGNAQQAGTVLRLCGPAQLQTGSAFITQAVRVDEGFDTRFQFFMSAAPEGMAFVVQGSAAGAQALGGNLWGLGYGFGATSNPITNCLAIELDAVVEGFLNDRANEVSIHTTGTLGNSENEGVSIGRFQPAADLSTGQVHAMRVFYVPGSIEIYIDDLQTPVLVAPFTFENGGTQLTGGSTGGLGLSGGLAWVGFTATTPSTVAQQSAEVRSWNWVSLSRPDACFDGNVGAGSGGPYDLLRINTGVGGFFRTVQLLTGDPFTLSVDPPPGSSYAPFVVFLTLGRPDASTVTTTIAGNACFPLLFAVDLGMAPAPLVFQVPPGLVLPSELTLQAAMIPDPSSPTTFGLTNAVSLQFRGANPPTVTAVTPTSAVVGGTVTILGTNFSPFATLDIDAVPVPVASLTPTQITFAMPTGVACDAVLTVHNPDRASASIAFNPTPIISREFGTSGSVAGGTLYIAIGTGFAVGCTATVGGVSSVVQSSAATSVVVRTPPGSLGPVPVVITTPGGCSVTSTFTYQ